jgi:hypothetical protein
MLSAAVIGAIRDSGTGGSGISIARNGGAARVSSYSAATASGVTIVINATAASFRRWSYRSTSTVATVRPGWRTTAVAHARPLGTDRTS